jgi:hypothetical protein
VLMVAASAALRLHVLSMAERTLSDAMPHPLKLGCCSDKLKEGSASPSNVGVGTCPSDKPSAVARSTDRPAPGRKMRNQGPEFSDSITNERSAVIPRLVTNRNESAVSVVRPGLLAYPLAVAGA